MFLRSKKIYVSILMLLITIVAFSQNRRSIHENENYYYKINRNKVKPDRVINISKYLNPSLKQETSKPDKYIFGWHPHWKGDAYTKYDFKLLSEISYFSYEVNKDNGSYYDIHNWKTTKLVQIAQSYGTKVSLTATLFGAGNLQAFLNNGNAVNNFITTIVKLIKEKGADGVNIDFEGLPGDAKDQFSTMIKNLSEYMRSEIPNSVLSIAMPAVDWSGAFDINYLNDYVDTYVMMGYDYHWKTSDSAGPIAPLKKSDR